MKAIEKKPRCIAIVPGASPTTKSMPYQAKITHAWDEWEYYYVVSASECRDKDDEDAYLTLGLFPSLKAISQGKIIVERCTGK